VWSGRGIAPSQISREVTNSCLSLHCRPRPWHTPRHRSRALVPHALRPYAVPCFPPPRGPVCAAAVPAKGRACRLCAWSPTAQVDAGEQALRATFCGTAAVPSADPDGDLIVVCSDDEVEEALRLCLQDRPYR
jgi:hypothetical protein